MGGWGWHARGGGKAGLHRFSGDTRPCHALIAAGQNATWLLHEATFEDQLVADAKAKRHSTLTEALSVGVQYASGAGWVLAVGPCAPPAG